MPHVRVKGVANPMQFPDDMDINDIRGFLQRKFTNQAIEGNQPADLDPLQGQARATEQTLAEKAGQGISNALVDSGIISDRFGAQQIGENVTSIGEFLPGIGDATAGDEFGRAAKSGDLGGMALGALGTIPIAGDLAKKVGSRLDKLKSIGFDVSVPLFRGTTSNETTGRAFTHFSKKPSVANSFSADPDLLTEMGIDLSLAEDMFSGANVSINYAKLGKVATMEDVKRVMSDNPSLSSKPIQSSFPELERLGFNSFDNEFETVIFNPKDFTGAFTDQATNKASK